MRRLKLAMIDSRNWICFL